MELKKIKVKTKCDNGACKNMADYEVVKEGTMPNMRLRLCEECLREIVSLSSQICERKEII